MVAIASAGPYAEHFPSCTPLHHHSIVASQSLPDANQQCQTTEGDRKCSVVYETGTDFKTINVCISCTFLQHHKENTYSS